MSKNPSFQIAIRSIDYPNQNPANLTYEIPEVLILPVPYSVAVADGSLINSIYNLSASLGNNIFKYYSPKTSTWITATLPDGTYNTAFLDTQIQSILTANNDIINTNGTITYPILFYASLNFDRNQLILSAGYQVDFTTSTLYQLLGFDSQIYSNTTLNSITFTAPNPAQYTSNSSNFFIQCDLVKEGIYINSNLGANSGVIYSINSSTPSFGVSLTTSYYDRFYYQLNTQRITNIKITYLDSLGQICDFQGEQTYLLLDFKPSDYPGLP